MAKAVILFLFLAFIFDVSYSKTYQKCELAKYLKGKIPSKYIPVYVCIASTEAGLKTDNLDLGYGIFSLGRDACGTATAKGGVCDLTCKSLYDEDISDDVKCAVKMYNKNKQQTADGFNYWDSYIESCSGEKGTKFTQDC